MERSEHKLFGRTYPAPRLLLKSKAWVRGQIRRRFAITYGSATNLGGLHKLSAHLRIEI